MERSEPFRGNISEQITDDYILEETASHLNESGKDGGESLSVSSHVSGAPRGGGESPRPHRPLFSVLGFALQP